MHKMFINVFNSGDPPNAWDTQEQADNDSQVNDRIACHMVTVTKEGVFHQTTLNKKEG